MHHRGDRAWHERSFRGRVHAESGAYLLQAPCPPPVIRAGPRRPSTWDNAAAPRRRHEDLPACILQNRPGRLHADGLRVGAMARPRCKGDG